MNHSEEHCSWDQELSWIELLLCCPISLTSGPLPTMPPATWCPEGECGTTTALVVEEHPYLGEFLKWGHLDLWAELMIAKAAVYYRINEHWQPHLPCLLSIHNILIKKVFMDEPILSKFNAQIRESTILTIQFSSVWFSRSVVSDSLWPRGPQHSRPPCPSPTPRVYSNSCPLSWRCHPPISSSVVSFSSCLQSFPASGPFQMSQLFLSGGQSIRVSASTSVLPMNTQEWSPLGWTGWISLQSKGLSRLFSNTTVQKHRGFGTHLSL